MNKGSKKKTNKIKWLVQFNDCQPSQKPPQDKYYAQFCQITNYNDNFCWAQVANKVHEMV